MPKRKKNDPPKKVDGLAIWTVITEVKTILSGVKENVDKLYDQMGSIEKNLNQVGLNKQSINTLKNNIKNINDTRIPNLKTKINKKVDSTAFYVIIAVLSIITTIVSLVSYYK